MGISVMVGALIPMLAFFYYTGSGGIIPSVLLTTSGLFIAGVVKSKYTNLSALRSGMEILIVAILAALAGYLIGDLFSNLF